MTEQQGVAGKVWQIVQPAADALGLSIWDIRYVKEGTSYFLRIFIDKPGGVGINDCEAFSRAIDAPLDQADPIRESYYLEVSSPGLGRELTRPKHFSAYIGRDVIIRLIRPLNGQKEFRGTLGDCSDGKIRCETDGGLLTFDRSAVAKVCADDLDF